MIRHDNHLFPPKFSESDAFDQAFREAIAIPLDSEPLNDGSVEPCGLLSRSGGLLYSPPVATKPAKPKSVVPDFDFDTPASTLTNLYF